MNNYPLHRVLRNMFLSVLLLFLCSIPIFYLTVTAQLNAEGSKEIFYGNLYIALRGLRLLLAVLLGCFIRKKNQEILSYHEEKRKKFRNILLVWVGISVWLHIDGTTAHLYGTVSETLGIFQGKVPVFLAVVWEQMLAGDLYWSILLCLVILFVGYRKPMMYKQTSSPTS